MATGIRVCLLSLVAACASSRVQMSAEARLQLAIEAFRQGRLEEALEQIAAARVIAPRDIEVLRWSAVAAELSWRDEDAVRDQMAAVRSARLQELPAEEYAQLQGRLGDLLFQVGRYGESARPLAIGAVGADQPRRGAFAELAALLPMARKFSGPILTEQPLLPGDSPEFVCGTSGRMRPMAIDTGTSMTTVARSFALDLDVQGLRSAGEAVDGVGRRLPIDAGVLPQFTIGDIEIGTVPVLVVDDAALSLHDRYGGPERVPRGVLGLDLLAACRLTLDPERRSVIIELPRGLAPGQSAPCVRVDGRCLLPVFVEGVRLWFVLDTGASHSSLTDLGVDALPGGSSRAAPAFRRLRTVGGALISVREVRDLVLRCSEARFLDVTLPVVSRGAAGWFPVHGVLGVDLLGLCRVTFDRGRVRMTAVQRQ